MEKIIRAREGVKRRGEWRGLVPKVDAKVGYEWRQNVFSSVTEHAAAKTHQC